MGNATAGRKTGTLTSNRTLSQSPSGENGEAEKQDVFFSLVFFEGPVMEIIFLYYVICELKQLLEVDDELCVLSFWQV